MITRHDLLIQFLEKKIDDRRFINLIRCMLKAGYLEDWTFHKTHSGAPQGGVITKLEYLPHEFDCKVDQMIERFNKGKRRKVNTEYKQFEYQISKLRKKYDAIKTKAQRNSSKY